MELSWMGFNMRPPTKQKEYWITVNNKYLDEPKAMLLHWSSEIRHGTEYGCWKLNGSKIPSTWEVTWWLELPPAKKD